MLNWFFIPPEIHMNWYPEHLHWGTMTTYSSTAQMLGLFTEFSLCILEICLKVCVKVNFSSLSLFNAYDFK